jgi:hypothetical protein
MEPMLDHVGVWIRKGRRSRRLLPEELTRGLGVPKEWEPSAFPWKHLSELLVCPSLAAHE